MWEIVFDNEQASDWVLMYLTTHKYNIKDEKIKKYINNEVDALLYMEHNGHDDDLEYMIETPIMAETYLMCVDSKNERLYELSKYFSKENMSKAKIIHQVVYTNIRDKYLIGNTYV